MSPKGMQGAAQGAWRQSFLPSLWRWWQKITPTGAGLLAVHFEHIISFNPHKLAGCGYFTEEETKAQSHLAGSQSPKDKIQVQTCGSIFYFSCHSVVLAVQGF